MQKLLAQLTISTLCPFRRGHLGYESADNKCNLILPAEHYPLMSFASRIG